MENRNNLPSRKHRTLCLSMKIFQRQTEHENENFNQLSVMRDEQYLANSQDAKPKGTDEKTRATR